MGFPHTPANSQANFTHSKIRSRERVHGSQIHFSGDDVIDQLTPLCDLSHFWTIQNRAECCCIFRYFFFQKRCILGQNELIIGIIKDEFLHRRYVWGGSVFRFGVTCLEICDTDRRRTLWVIRWEAYRVAVQTCSIALLKYVAEIPSWSCCNLWHAQTQHGHHNVVYNHTISRISWICTCM